ncbi:MAG: murein transglycosylase A [Burkholderiales bacterium]|nr:murein transglycosylase A [Burkholderiales bacterium]
MRYLIATLSLALLAACATAPAPSPNTNQPECTCAEPAKPAPVTARYSPQDWSALPDWPGEGALAEWPAWLESCKRLKARPAWKDVCAAAQQLNPTSAEQIRSYFETSFQPIQVTTSEGSDHGLITGYYEPLLKGSTAPKPGSVPLYSTPDDLLDIELGDIYPELKGLRLRGRVEGRKVIPYWNSDDIANGKAQLSGKTLVWVDDPIEAFFLQVQGSGRVRLDDGSMLRLGYAEQNGYPYKSIGKWLIDRGELKASEASMQGIQAWARAHPERLRELLAANPSFVFFRVLPSAEGGPIGALNAPLTDGYSAAVDARFIPLGTPLYLATTMPNQDKPLNRLLHAQDTGGAIRGPIRLDLFWGYGPEAGALAGRMKQQGRIWLIWPKNADLPASK